MVDAIVNLTETGNSLRANKLRIVDTLLKTNTKLIANKKSWEDPFKRQKIENIAMMLEAALEAADKVGLKLNAPKSNLDEILEILPALRNPTVNRLSDECWLAVEVILSEKDVRDIIPKLKDMGAEGIIEYPLNKVVY
jgi:ATP phosphoribosyltransferase